VNESGFWLHLHVCNVILEVKVSGHTRRSCCGVNEGRNATQRRSEDDNSEASVGVHTVEIKKEEILLMIVVFISSELESLCVCFR